MKGIDDINIVYCWTIIIAYVVYQHRFLAKVNVCVCFRVLRQNIYDEFE